MRVTRNVGESHGAAIYPRHGIEQRFESGVVARDLFRNHAAGEFR